MPVSGSAKLIRAINASAALTHLLEAGELTRSELRQRTGLSKPTASEMLRLLTAAGLAVVSGRTTGTVGPTAEIYATNGDAAYTVAVSVRDTLGSDRPSLGAALSDLSGTIRARSEARIDFTARTPPAAVARAVTEVCARAGVDPSRVSHVHLGVPGAYDPRTDTLHQVAVAGWDRSGVVAAIEATLAHTLAGTVTVALDNDVKLAAIAERHRGAAADAESFCLLWLGAGVGLATDLGGVLLRGSRGGAGEIGYLPLCADQPHADQPHADQRELQDLIGGPAVVDLAAEFGIAAASPAEAMAAAVAGNVAAVVERLAARIAFALATVVAVLDPPLIVLAGEVAQAGGTTLRDAVAAAMHPSTEARFPSLAEGDVQVAVTAVDDDAVLLGGLDAGLRALHGSLISSLAQPSTD